MDQMIKNDEKFKIELQSDVRKIKDMLTNGRHIINVEAPTEPVRRYTPKDVQKIWGISEVTQWKKRKNGELPFESFGRRVFYNETELIGYLKKKETKK